MTNPQPRSRCRILSFASPRTPASATGGPSVGTYPTHANISINAALLSLIGDQRVLNLAELARAIAADRNLCGRVTEAACREFGRPWLNVEQAIVLLGRERLASQILRLPHINRNPSAEQLRLPEMLQGISE
jgi:hypothetical protein